MARDYTYNQIRGAISACEHKIRVEPSNLMKTFYAERLAMWKRRLKELQEKADD